MIANGKAFVRVAQLRARIAALVRGGQFGIVIDQLGELVRADLALGLPADALLRARQAAELAAERSESVAGPLVVLAATLLAADAPEQALEACTAAIDRARAGERPRIEAMARLVGGAAQRRAHRFGEARLLLDAARGTAARIGDSRIAGIALCELGWLDLAEDRPAAAATCFQFGAEFLRRAHADAALEAAALCVASWAAAGDVEVANERAVDVTAAARGAGRLDLVAYVDSVRADLALRRTPEVAAAACARAAESAHVLGAGPLARELGAQARLRQVRIASDASDRARHLEAGIELALALDRTRAGMRLGAFLISLVEDAERDAHPPARSELEQLAGAITRLGDSELADMARAVLDELG